MNRKITANDIQVTKDDQANINTFSKLYSKHKQNQQLLKQIVQKINQQQDTISQMQLNDDNDPVRYRFGNSFITLTTQQVKIFVQRQQKKLKQQQIAINKQMEEGIKKMKKLKATLYNKFGNSINLDQ